MRPFQPILFLLCLPALTAHATIFGNVQGIVHDPQDRPLANSTVTLQPSGAADPQTVLTGTDGVFRFPAVALGDYTLSATASGFGTAAQTVTVQSDTTPVFHLELPLATIAARVTVHDATPAGLNPSSATPATLIREQDIAQTPGADLANSLAAITDFVPGAYVTHDQLHIRGGHQVSWLIDGVEIPNTNIATNLGAQINPRDIDYLQISRGSYTADLGDRTYGVFDVLPQNGFSRNRDAELTLTAGSFLQTDDQLSFGSHTERLGWYASLNGNRSDYALAPPIGHAFHDAGNGFGGFGSLLFNRTPSDQFRFVAQLRRDFFQIPYDPDPNSRENQIYNSSGLRDAQTEVDGLTTFSWVHIFPSSTVLQVSPFFHYNSADYAPGSQDTPVGATSNRASTYGGLQASIGTSLKKNSLEAGFYSFGQHDSNFFANTFADASFPDFQIAQTTNGGLIEEWLQDTYKVAPGLTALGGVRFSQFRADVNEGVIYPRAGLAYQVPKINWVFRAFYGRYYQPPPLLTTAGPLLAYAESSNTTLVPLRGERDEEHQFGVQIPLPGFLNAWVLDADTFQTRANNFLDHSNLGESSIFLPVTINGALIQGWEVTLRSPRLPHGGDAHLTYSNQLAQQRGAINGGLICAPIGSPECDATPGYHSLDHDQRNTLNLGYRSALPWRTWASFNVYYGSGFTNGSQGDPNDPYPHLPGHTTVDLSLGQSFGENATLSVTSTNLANRRVLLDNSLTFGGFHYNDPRMIYAELRYRFKF